MSNWRQPLTPDQRAVLRAAREARRDIARAQQALLDAVHACRKAGVSARQTGEWVGVTGKTICEWTR